MNIIKVSNPKEGIKTAFHILVDAIHQTESLRLALSGGTTPIALFELMAAWSEQEPKLDEKLKICWVDERVVPFQNHRSNYGNAIQTWPTINKLIHCPFPVSVEKDLIANEYYLQLIQLGFANRNHQSLVDYALLGMGTDGHVASVFPNVDLQHQNNVAAVCFQPEQDEWRATLTIPFLKQSKHNLALVFGADKKAVLQECLQGNFHYPFAQLVKENLILITDQDVE